MDASSPRRERLSVKVNFAAYPVQASLGPLGRKWALLVLMKIALAQAQRFNEMLRTTPGMSKRILAKRLGELEHHGFIVRAEQARSFARWELTQKGADVLPVLLTLIHFDSKWSARTPSSETGSGPLRATFEVTYVPGTRGSPSAAPARTDGKPKRRGKRRGAAGSSGT